LDGKFPHSWVFWGNNLGKARAIDLYSVVELNGGKTTDFILGDVSIVTYSEVKKREKIIQSKMESVLLNLAELSTKFASEVIGGDLTIFPSAMLYQQKKINNFAS